MTPKGQFIFDEAIFIQFGFRGMGAHFARNNATRRDAVLIGLLPVTSTSSSCTELGYFPRYGGSVVGVPFPGLAKRSTAPERNVGKSGREVERSGCACGLQHQLLEQYPPTLLSRKGCILFTWMKWMTFS
ncbi:hypothetical protein QOT17_015417 [Balamuthia mandrillaris]